MPNDSDLKSKIPVKISVVVPIGDLKLYKKNVLNLVVAAKSINAETILVFDGASQNEIDQIKESIEIDHKDVILVSVSCNNPGGSRNAGKALATGDWITFWDCDDVPNALEIQSIIKEADDLEQDVVVGRFEAVYLDGDSNEIYRKESKQLLKSDWEFTVGLMPGIWRFGFRSSIAKCIDFPELRMGEDQVFIARLLSRKADVFLSNRIAYNYLIGRDSQLTSNLNVINDKVMAAKLLAEIFTNIEDEFTELKFTMLIKMHLSILKVGEFPFIVRIRHLFQALKILGLHQPEAFRLMVVIFREKIRGAYVS
jgi:glycosyltransferase involved in cell wall biosynthesis